MNNPDSISSQLIEWPAIGASPIYEYVTSKLLDMAFSTLFPDGRCDWLEPRMKRVYLHEFYKHLIQYQDHHFGKYPRFRYFMTNMIMQHHAQSSSSVFVKRNLQYLPITINELHVYNLV